MTVVLALVAVLIPASVTLVGYWIQRQAGKRLQQEHEQEGARLKLESVMRASELLSPPGDTIHNPGKSAAGLLALTQLDHAALAIGLLADLWCSLASPASPASQVGAQVSFRISDETAILVVKAVLASNEPTAQFMAAELLYRKAPELDINNPIYWPGLMGGHWIKLSVPSKLLLVDALVKMALSSPPSTNSIRELSLRLYDIWNADKNRGIQSCTSAFMLAIVPALSNLGVDSFIRADLGHGPVTFGEINRAASTHTPYPDDFYEKIILARRRQLEEWSSAYAPDQAPGNLTSHSFIENE